MKKLLVLITLFLFKLTGTYAQPGHLDHSFGFNGLVTSPFSTVENNSTTGRSMITLPDGNLLITGYSDFNGWFLFNMHPDGSANIKFGANGFLTIKGVNLTAGTMLQPGGKILVGGSVYGAVDSFRLVRLTIDGTIDSSFGVNGKQAIDFGAPRPELIAWAVGRDGKIVLAGSVTGESPSVDKLGVIARYNANGGPDTTFSSDGKLVIRFNKFIPASLAIQDDGKIVAVGQSVIARFNKDGSLDKSFSKSGRGVDEFGPGYSYNSVAVQQDGKIVACGSLNSDVFATFRLNNNGKPDTSFSGDGKQTTNVSFADTLHRSQVARGISIQENGKIMINGDYYDIDGQQLYSVFIGLDTKGNIDSSFAPGGIYSFSASVSTLIVKPAGERLILGTDSHKGCGRHNPECSNYFYVTKYLTGNPPLQLTARQFPKGNGNFIRTAIQTDGRIVVIDAVVQVVARYNSDGTLDSTFGNQGYTSAAFAPTSLAIQPDGKIVVTGNIDNGTSYMTVARFNTDGSADSTFNLVGSSQVHIHKDQVYAMALGNDGKIVLVGGVPNKVFENAQQANIDILRFNANGSPDSTFSRDGKQVTDFGGRQIPCAVAIQTDGRIVIAGSTGSGSWLIARYNKDGSLDTRFSEDGKQTIDFGIVSYATSMVIQPDGKVVISGSTATFDVPKNQWLYDFAVARLNTDGTPDYNFSGDGKLTTDFTYDDRATSLALQTDGKIVAGGYSIVQNVPVAIAGMALCRYNIDGSLDSGFGNRGKQLTYTLTGSSRLSSIAVFNQKLYAAGFTLNEFGSASHASTIGILARFVLDKTPFPPVVSIINPGMDTNFIVQSRIVLTAAASDPDGAIRSVEFYNDGKLLFSKTDAPYTVLWDSVPTGSYHITAVATDNDGLKTTSAPVHITVLHNRPPVVAITSPVNGDIYQATPPGATILLSANAAGHGTRIKTVKFYSGTILIHTEQNAPYLWTWKNVPSGTYTLSANAIDASGRISVSAPVTITVTPADAQLVSRRMSVEQSKTDVTDAIKIMLSPNPVSNILNIQTTGLQNHTRVTVLVISSSGVVLQTKKINNIIAIAARSTIQLTVSTLLKGVYTIKLVSGNKVVYGKFVKM